MTTEIWITYSNSHLVCEKQNNRKQQQRSESPTVTLTWCVEKKEEKKNEKNTRGNDNRDLNRLH